MHGVIGCAIIQRLSRLQKEENIGRVLHVVQTVGGRYEHSSRDALICQHAPSVLAVSLRIQHDQLVQ
ncbi:hypothetical protein GGP41_000103 [Bipolaris sorokiniana]|uniref:Uncharacterized protein n=1 Tax=Cochliobolus sativus TaxID=45130 RepID=A0A8H5ZBT7_COCSA|nr:hypothetical protein GGP41_000103 [Bipolaris sorokiniana]